jgi:putative membrane protein
MKRITIFSIAASLILFAVIFISACNNDADNNTATSDTATTPRMENSGTTDTSSQRTVATDDATKDFLMKAADGGMAEVNAGQMAQEKGANAGVKRFANMMIQDHSNANDQIKSLASSRSVTLPAAPSEEHQKMNNMVGEKTGKNFDKAYMDMMLDDHQKTISMFEQASRDTKDDEVRNFINSTIPKLKMHLDSARAVRKGL